MHAAPPRVPVRNKAFIEREADRLLEEYVAETGSEIEGTAIPVEEIARYHLCLQLGFADLHDVLDLPKYDGGPDILGAVFFEQSAILIDDCLNPEIHPEQLGRYHFSLAHEVGHWRLHREVLARRRSANAEHPAFICRQSEAETVPVEWQAETFASYLLLPRARVLEQWRALRGSDEPFAFDVASHGSPRLRRLWFGLASDGQEARALHARECARLFDALAADFAKMFAVSTSAMRVRLEGLKLLQRVRQRSQATNLCA
jgi:Zn-dependent peptidase ImmA (M78 family)